MSIDDPDKLRYSTVIGTFWNVVMGWGAVFIGLLGRAIVPAVENLPDMNSEMIYLVLSSKFFGPVLYGLLIGGIFAAILSTADSQLLVVASTFVRDIYEKIIKKDIVLDESRRLRLSRTVVILSGILALALAYVAKDLIFWLVLFAWGGLGASFGPTVILSLFWKQATKWGVFAGLVSGTLMTIIWKSVPALKAAMYELVPAFLVSTFLTIVISLVTQSNTKLTMKQPPRLQDSKKLTG